MPYHNDDVSTAEAGVSEVIVSTIDITRLLNYFVTSASTVQVTVDLSVTALMVCGLRIRKNLSAASWKFKHVDSQLLSGMHCTPGLAGFKS